MQTDVAAWLASEREPDIVGNVIRHVLAMARVDRVPVVAGWVAMSTQADDVTEITGNGESDAGRASKMMTVATSDSQDSDVELARGGNHDAFARLIAHQQQRIGRTMWRFTRNRNEWEELVQDVFVEAYYSLPSLKASSRFGSWLQTIAVRTGYQFWKHRERDRKLNCDPIQWSQVIDLTDSPGSAVDAAELVHHVLQKLPTRDRLVMTLMYLEELSIAEIAAQVGWSETMVKVQAHRARRKLKRVLESSHVPAPARSTRGERESS